MNTLVSFVTEVGLTFVISVLLVRYLHPFLQKILADLCGTEERAQFWTAFSSILLTGMPIIIALNYRPESGDPQILLFEMTRKLSGNLAGFLLALISIGFMVSLFALFAPKQRKAEAE